jgi:hypothetical protein
MEMNVYPGAPFPFPRGPAPTFTELKRVIPIAKSQPCGSATLTLLSLEEYLEGYIVTARLILGERKIVARQSPHLVFRTTDDQGNRYEGWCVGGGSKNELRAECKFTPSLDQNARELTVEIDGVHWVVWPQPQQGGQGQKPEVDLDPGPCMFVIRLAQ